MSLSLEQNIKILINDVVSHRKAVAIGFLTIVVAALILGWTWPKMYTSSATIIADEKNIIQPLMQGAAVPTDVMDRAKLAEEVIHSRGIMDRVLKEAGWLQGDPTPFERQQIMDGIKKRTTITTIGTNLIKVSYKDSDPDRAYRTAKTLVAAFISETAGTKMKESESAFNFIDAQVKEYQEKLTQADQRLKAFRSGGLDGLVLNSNGHRMDDLGARLEQTQLDLKEAKMRRAALASQVEAAAASAPERQHRAQLAEYQAKLDALRLQYQDTFPDIVRIKSEIAQLKKQIAADEKRNPGNHVALDSSTDSQFNQQLRQELSQAETRILTLTARLDETKRLMDQEQQVNNRLNKGETLADLTRNYEINQGILDDLLKRREAARVSMNLDRQKQGLAFHVQDDANLPVEPSAPQFSQFAMGGLLLGITLPLMLLYVRNQVDARIRDESVVADKLNLPVVTVVPHLLTPDESASVTRGLQWLAILVSSVIFIVLSIVWSGNHL